jgi:hypothetical protein
MVKVFRNGSFTLFLLCAMPSVAATACSVYDPELVNVPFRPDYGDAGDTASRPMGIEGEPGGIGASDSAGQAGYPGPGGGWLVENGKDSAHPDDAENCLNLSAGVYSFDIVYQFYDPNHRHKLVIRYCHGGASACTPDQPITGSMLRAP